VNKIEYFLRDLRKKSSLSQKIILFWALRKKNNHPCSQNGIRKGYLEMLVEIEM
jgi:hypothetical protein